MSLWNDIAALQMAAVVSAFILTIGAVIEYWASLRLLALLSLKWLLRKSTPFERCAFKKLFIHAIGPILVVPGIGGEVVFEGRDFVVEDEQEIRSQQTIQSLKTTVSQNEKDAAQLGKDAERLKKDTEDEHTARVEAEETVAWRRLTPGNRQKLRAELSPFSINRTWFQYNSNDIEAFDFGSDLAASLPTSWNPTEPSPVMSMREGPVKLGTNGPLERGIRVAASGDKTYAKAADVLARLISSFGFDCERTNTVLAYNQQYAPMVVVSIDPRPEGSQGDAKLRREARRKQAKRSQAAKP